MLYYAAFFWESVKAILQNNTQLFNFPLEPVFAF